MQICVLSGIGARTMLGTMLINKSSEGWSSRGLEKWTLDEQAGHPDLNNTEKIKR